MEHSEKKTQAYSWGISEIIPSEKGGYLNAYRVFFLKILLQETCWRVAITADNAKSNFYTTFSTFCHRSSWEAWPFVRCVLSGPYVKPLFAGAKYSHHNTGNLLQPIQVHLSWKLNILQQYFIVFSESI